MPATGHAGGVTRARFADRPDAGRRLAELLAELTLDDPVVLGLPRGGVIVAAEVARALDAPLDVLVVRKVGHPHQPELGLGAVTEDGTVTLDERRLRAAGMTPETLGPTVTAELSECRRRADAYRGGDPPPDVSGRTAVLVDDGVATGVTALAGVGLLHRSGAALVVVAAPVASTEATGRLRTVADQVVVPVVRTRFVAVSGFYERFTQTSDDEVVAALATARRSR